MIYSRRQDIHAKYGRNWQSGICPSTSFPYIFIFSGKSGEQHGYQDGWDNPNVFTYTGEGQSGDMQFTRGNLALKNHIKTGKRVFLFESVSKGFVRFKSELEFYDVDYFETKDTSGNIRIGLKFFFKRKGAFLPIQPLLFYQPLIFAEPQSIYEINQPNKTERQGLVTSRVGQGAYRKRIVHRWEYKCAVTDNSEPSPQVRQNPFAYQSKYNTYDNELVNSSPTSVNRNGDSSRKIDSHFSIYGF